MFTPIPKQIRLCLCGCNQPTRKSNKYVHGHNGKRGVTYVTVICNECGKKFLREPWSAHRRRNLHFCNRKCSDIYLGKERKGKPIPKLMRGEYRYCKSCNGRFYAQNANIKRGAGKYCSRKCVGLDKALPQGSLSSLNNKGINNPNYKHGNRIGGHVSHKELKIKVANRDGNWCLLCGMPNETIALHVHRVIYGSQGGKYELCNCVLLCPQHHESVHQSKVKWKDLLLNHINGSLNIRRER